MKKLSIFYSGMLLLLLISCKVTFITGYDQVLDQTITKVKTDFNVHFIKLTRVTQDEDPNNQKFENFQDYYDHLEADLITIKTRTKFLDDKAGIVKRQVANVDSIFHAFIALHKRGIPDRSNDDHRDISNGINSSLDAITFLQEQLKSTGKSSQTN
jgi:hypothetical protein